MFINFTGIDDLSWKFWSGVQNFQDQFSGDRSIVNFNEHRDGVITTLQLQYVHDLPIVSRASMIHS